MADREPKEKLLEKIRERQAESRRKLRRRLLKVGGALLGLAVVLAVSYPFLQVVWHKSKAQSSDADTRKESLQWLSDHDVSSAVPVFLKALQSTRGESDIAFEALRKLGEPSIVPELARIWKDTTVLPRGRYNALQLLAEKGGREYMDVFIDPLAILSEGWESSFDFLRRYADEGTVKKLLDMLKSGDERRETAAAVALRYTRKNPLVGESGEVRNALAAKLKSPFEQVRMEAADALIGIADRNQLPQLLEALDDESIKVSQCAALAIGGMEPEVAVAAVPKLLEKLLHPDGEVCTGAADALMKVGGESALPRLLEIVADRSLDSFSRERAVEILRTIHDPKVLEALAAALKDPEVNVAREAARALSRVGDETSVGPLADALGSVKSEKLRLHIAYALGMLGDRKAVPALLGALREGGVELSKFAGEALLRIGARDEAGELIDVARNPQSSPVARREAVFVLSSFRTASGLEVTIEALTDEVSQVREEAKNASIQLAGDLLGEKTSGLEAARQVLLNAAQDMLQKDIGARLSSELAQAKSMDEMNSAVLAAMRHLHEKNSADFEETLVPALEKAKAVYWTSLMRVELEALGKSETEIRSAAETLKDYVKNTYLPLEPPGEAHREMGDALKKLFGF
jgi:HEAT repeat protein